MLGVDYGRRRIGLAVSDHSATLARPFKTIPAGSSPRVAAEAVAGLIKAAADSDDGDLEGIGAIVVGLPRRLGGEDTDLSAPARAFAAALATLTGFDVQWQDERLSSHEADARLAVGERDWRVRKKKLDAAAAAVILQDYLDRV